jgi:hypothetical protein
MPYKYILQEILSKTQTKGVKLILDWDNDYIKLNNSMSCSGYFDDKSKVLCCAIGNKKVEDWLGTLLHEFSHFEQWDENCDVWVKSQSYNFTSDEILDMWLNGEEINNIKEIVLDIAHLEYDCEIRASKKIHSFPKILLAGDYIKKANAYIAFYKQMYDKRKWYDASKAPYLNKNIIDNMPDKFLNFNDYFKNYKFDTVNWDACF